MKNPLVSIIILNYNGRNYISDCVRSVLNSSYDNFEVIIVDNASTDGSYELVVKEFGNDPRVKIMRNKKNLGFSGGNNVGLRIAKGKYIVLLNNDTVVSKDWLKKLVWIMENHENIGIIQPLVVNLEDKEIIQSIGFIVDKILLLSKSIGRGIRVDSIKNNILIKGISYAYGACLMIRRECFKRVGFFDPKLKFYFDDNYWGLLCNLKGFLVASTTSTKIYHKGGAILSKRKENVRMYHSTISRLALITRLFPKLRVWASLIAFFFLWSTYSILRSIKNRNARIILSVLGGYKWYLKNFGYIWLWRKKILMNIRYKMLFKHMSSNPLASIRILQKIISKISREK